MLYGANCVGTNCVKVCHGVKIQDSRFKIKNVGAGCKPALGSELGVKRFKIHDSKFKMETRKIKIQH